MKQILVFSILLMLSFSCNALPLIEKDWYSYDKAKHVAYSASIMYWTMSFNKDYSKLNKNNLMVSAGITISIGGVKELIDLKIKKTEWSWKDITADIAGIAIGAVIYNNIKI